MAATIAKVKMTVLSFIRCHGTKVTGANLASQTEKEAERRIPKTRKQMIMGDFHCSAW